MSIYLFPSRTLGLKRWIKGAQETWFDLCNLCSFHMLYLRYFFSEMHWSSLSPPQHTHTIVREILWSLLGMCHLLLRTPSQLILLFMLWVIRDRFYFSLTGKSDFRNPNLVTFCLSIFTLQNFLKVNVKFLFFVNVSLSDPVDNFKR